MFAASLVTWPLIVSSTLCVLTSSLMISFSESVTRVAVRSSTLLSTAFRTSSLSILNYLFRSLSFSSKSILSCSRRVSELIWSRSARSFGDKADMAVVSLPLLSGSATSGIGVTPRYLASSATCFMTLVRLSAKCSKLSSLCAMTVFMYSVY